MGGLAVFRLPGQSYRRHLRLGQLFATMQSNVRGYATAKITPFGPPSFLECRLLPGMGVTIAFDPATYQVDPSINGCAGLAIPAGLELGPAPRGRP
jgi:hypothetical protein